VITHTLIESVDSSC